MITLTVQRRYGAATVRARVVVESVERAIELCNGDDRIVPPAELERFRAATGETPGKGLTGKAA